MSRKEIKTAILKQLSDLLKSEGFEKRIYGQSIRKKIDQDTSVKIHLSFIDHEHDFDIKVDVGIRFDELENLKNKDNKLLTEKEKSSTSTIGTELGNISIGKPKRWTIRNEKEIDPVIKDIYKDIKSVLFPFIEKYSNRENVYNLCFRDDDEANKISPLDHKRAINAVGLAILLNKKENVNELVLKKKRFLENKGDFGLTTYLNFVKRNIN